MGPCTFSCKKRQKEYLGSKFLQKFARDAVGSISLIIYDITQKD